MNSNQDDATEAPANEVVFPDHDPPKVRSIFIGVVLTACVSMVAANVIAGWNMDALIEGVRPVVEARMSEIEGRIAAAALLATPQFDEAIEKSVSAISSRGVSPIGCVVAWPSDAPVPDGWRICDGSSVNSADDSAIASVLGSTYGSAGAGKVKLPDFRGYFLRGAGGINADGKFAEPQSNSTAMPNNRLVAAPDGAHTHEFAELFDTSAKLGKGGAVGINGWLRNKALQPNVVAPVQDHTHRILGGDRETRPHNFAVHWIIRVK
jgi:Phage Tail Collar Domain